MSTMVQYMRMTGEINEETTPTIWGTDWYNLWHSQLLHYTLNLLNTLKSCWRHEKVIITIYYYSWCTSDRQNNSQEFSLSGLKSNMKGFIRYNPVYQQNTEHTWSPTQKVGFQHTRQYSLSACIYQSGISRSKWAGSDD